MRAPQQTSRLAVFGFSLLIVLACVALFQNAALAQRSPLAQAPPQQSHKLNLQFSGEEPRPLAMVSGDFDEDGVPDLVIGYGVPTGGSIVLLHGNREAITPETETGLLSAGRHEYADPFLQRSEPILLTTAPSLLVSADVNGDGHLDLVYATQGGTQLNVMLGDGKGNFLPPIRTSVPGEITALSAYRPGPPVPGEAVIAGYRSRDGGRVELLSFSGAGLSMRATYALPVAPSMFVVDNLDADFIPDTAMVAGGQLLVLHGKDAINGRGQLETLPVNGAESVAAGDFLFDRNSGVQLSVVTSRGETLILAHEGYDLQPYTTQQLAQARRASQHAPMSSSTLAQPETGTGGNPWVVVERQTAPALQHPGSQAPILLRARMSGSGGDDLVVLNPSQQQRVVISHNFVAARAPDSALVPASQGRVTVGSLGSDDVVAALSMRVNADGRQGLVILNASDPSPEFVVPSAGNTLYVNTTADNTGTTTDPDDGTRCTMGSGEICTLRDAVVFANADASDNITSGTSDTIEVPAGTYSLTWQAGALDSNKNAVTHLEILGPMTIIGTTGTVINGNNNDTIFTINPGPFGYYSTIPGGSTSFLTFAVTLENLTIENGKNQNNPANSSTGDFNNVGGCVNWTAGGSGNLTISNSTITSCSITWGAGGGIWAWNADGVGSATLILSGDTISNNSTSEQGGGVYMTGGPGTVYNPGNFTGGGPVALSATNTTISGNLASITVNTSDPLGGADLGYGGGLFINPRSSGSSTPQSILNGVTISSNTADGDGGGIYTNSGILLETSVVQSNSSKAVSTAGDQYWGGGFYIEVAAPETAATITSTNFLSNSATTSGGGIYVGPGNPTSGTSLQVSLSRIFGNTSTSGTTGLGTGSPGAATATENWWGCNTGPGNTGCDGADSGATTSPQAQFLLSATSTTTITLGGNIGLSITLDTDSSNNPITGAFPAVATNYPYTFSVSGVTATLPSTGTFNAAGTGTATLTPTSTGGGSVSATFDNQTSSVSFIVNAATQTITFGALPNVTYGVSPITLTATASSGLPVSYAVTGPATVAGSILTITGAGMVTVTASQAGNTEYPAATPVTQSFTVNKAPLLVTANNASRPVNTANPVFTYTITGFVNGDTISVVSGTAAETTTATISSPAGTYPITFSVEGLTAANYTFTYVGGILTVAGKSQTTIASLTSTTATINVFGFGFTAPSGELSFNDVTTSSPVAAPVTLNTATATTALLPQVTSSTGANTLPVWTTLADLNGDGKLDLVTSLYLTDSVSVQLGNGDGTFQPATDILIATGFGPAEVHAVDLGNGAMDLIVASFNLNQIAVLLGNGNGTFQPPELYTVGSATNTPTSLTTGDFNHDGNVDVAVANTGDNTVSILLGNGSGALTPEGTPIPVGRDPEAIRAGDFNSDGYSDLTVANFVDGTVTALLNNRDGTFTARTISVGSGAGSGPQALAINGSGSSLLLAVANYMDNTVSVMKSNGDGTFGAQTIVSVGKGPDDVNFADFNGDGIPDLVVSNYTSDTVNLLLGSSGGSYSVLGPFTVGNSPYSAAIGDLDQDGTPDIVVSNCFSNNAGVLLSGTQISVQYSGLSLPAGNTLNATYTPDGASKYGASTSPNVTAP